MYACEYQRYNYRKISIIVRLLLTGDPLLWRLLHPVHLPLRAYLRRTLGHGSPHVAQQAPYGITGVDMLSEDLKVGLLTLQCVGDPSQR